MHTIDAVLPPPDGQCDLTQVGVVPSVPPVQEAKGLVDLRLAFATRQPKPCTLDLAADRLLLSITADDEQVWSSTRCQDAVPEQTVVLRPFWTHIVPVSWTGRQSGFRCASGTKFVGPGPYELHTAVLGGEPSATSFTLLEPPPKPLKPLKPLKPKNAQKPTKPQRSDAPELAEPPQQPRIAGAPEPGDEELASND